MRSVTYILLLTVSVCSAFTKLKSKEFPKGISEHQFLFKGYNTEIKDVIIGEDGDFIFVGNVALKENHSKDRDSRLDAIYKFEDFSIDEASKGILIFTDSQYNIKKLEGSHASYDKILFDKKNNKYWIGGNANYYHKDYYYQIAFTTFNSKMKMIGQTVIENNGHTYFRDMIFRDGALIVLGMEMKGEMASTQYIPKIFEISTTKVHDATTFRFPGKAPDVLYTASVDYPKQYHFNHTKLFLQNGFVCFSIGHAIDTNYGIKFFHYNQGDVVSFNQLMNVSSDHSPSIINFSPYKERGYLYAYAEYFSKKGRIVISDEALYTKLEKVFTVEQYPDFNQMIEMPNGEIVILSVNKTKTWSYYIYNAELKFEREINSNVSEKYYPSLFKIVDGNTLMCSMYSTKAEPAVLQTLVL